MRVLFITWDGPQTDYLEALFLPIFQRLAADGRAFHILQFTWADDEKVNHVRECCKTAGIPYRRVRVWRRFRGAGVFLSIIFGRRAIRDAVQDWNIDTLMPRSLMPALAVLSMRKSVKLSIMFDADGFAADERVDFGNLSSQSWTYRLLRDVEAQMVRVADVVVVRTVAAVRILQARGGPPTDIRKFFVVSNGRDPSCYLTAQVSRPNMQIKKSYNECGFTLCYAGSIGPQYCLGTMLAIALALRRSIPNLTFRIMTADTEKACAEMKRLALNDQAWIRIQHLAPKEIPAALAASDLALALRKPTFSVQGVAPIKLGEYLMAGVPVVGAAAAGETDELVKAGVMLPSDGEDTDAIVDWATDVVIPEREALDAKCRELGVRLFSIGRSVEQYRSAFGKLDSGTSCSASLNGSCSAVTETV